MTRPLLEALETALGHDIVSKGGEDGTVVAILKPSSTAEVASAVKACADLDLAIVPRGGNSNVCAMTEPPTDRRCVFLDLARMNRILEVNPTRSTMTVEAGCILQVVQEAAAEHGRLFAPDWGARGSAMIGGAVATNGGGPNVFRFGTTREQVLGMEVVLPDGRIWEGLRGLRKDNSGYDLKQLFIGSEGTLGIITRLVLKLHPAPVTGNSMMAVLTDQARLIDYLNLARSIAGDTLVAFELINGIGYENALKRYPDLRRPLETRADWYVLIRLAGAEPVDDTLAAIFEAGFDQGYLADAVMAQTKAQEETLWEIRDQMIPKQYFPDRPMCKWDVSVPIDRITTFLQRAEAIATAHQPEAISYAIGHVGDGNIHYSIFPLPKAGTDIDALSQTYIREIDALIWDLGGSITAEHGVGALFVDRMRGQKSDIEYAMMQDLKALFDPKGIMNPGKLLKSTD